MNDSGVHAIVAGGGTAGHVMPALAIGAALVRRGHPPGSIRFVGAARGMEKTLVPAAGFEVILLPGRGIARRLSASNFSAVVGLAVASARAIVLVRRMRPSVLVSVGGYAAVPATLAAWLWRVPIVVAEQNAVPGMANRLAGRVARYCAVAFEGTALPRSVVTGNPVRAELVDLDRSHSGMASARTSLGIPEGRRVVLVSGGSLGSRRINQAVSELVLRWAGRGDIAIRHVLGARNWDGQVAAHSPPALAQQLVYQRIQFENRMDLAYRAADVVVARAGGAVFELAAAGVASILVPLPGAPGDHQSANARRMAAAGAAVVVPDAELDGERLAGELEALLYDQARLDAMGEAASRLAKPGSADDIAALVDSAAATREPAGSPGQAELHR